jgi:hypothetical protein
MLAEGEPGRGEYILGFAQDLRGAVRTIFKFMAEPFEVSDMLRGSIVSRTSDSLTLNRVVLAAYPCKPHSARGLAVRACVLDELGFMVTGEGVPVDVELLRSIRPCLATSPASRLLILSSPYGSTGALYDIHRKHFAREDSPILVWQGSAPEMNPTLPADYLARMEQEDPQGFRSEVLGEFRTGTSALLDGDSLEAVVVRGRRELAPVEGITYRAFVDPSGGRVDAFTLAIGHERDGIAVVDLVRAWRSPLNPSGVIAECAGLLKPYGVREVTGDRYGGEFPREGFRSHDIGYTVAEKPKSDLYLHLMSTINSGAVEIPDSPELLRELRGLERRRGSSGRDRVDHRPGGHDDQANVIAGVVCTLGAGAPAVSGVYTLMLARMKAREEAEEKDEAARQRITVEELRKRKQAPAPSAH